MGLESEILKEEERYCMRTTTRFPPEQVGGDGLQVLPALRCYMSVSEGDYGDAASGISSKKNHLNCRYSHHPCLFPPRSALIRHHPCAQHKARTVGLT